MQPDVIVLLGPSGAGKTTIGHLLDRCFGCVFLSLEAYFLTQYPSYEQYRAHREEAYRRFEHLVVETRATHGKTTVFEEVGLSPMAQTLITNIQQRYDTALVQVLASEDLCVRRVTARSTTSNFPKPPETVQHIYRQYLAVAPARYTFTLELTNEDAAEDVLVQHLGHLFSAERGGPTMRAADR